MKSKCLAIVTLVLSVTPVFSQVPPKVKKFILFQIDPSCICTKVKKETKTTIATEINAGKATHKVVYQVFWSRTTPRHELFRIEIGDYSSGKLVKTWHYGIAAEGDFNGDGLPDYSWYGGDDTGEELYLFLSSDSGYKRVDLLKTVEAAWQRRFNKPPPDLGELEDKYELDDLILENSTAGLILNATVRLNPISATPMTTKRTYRFSIQQADFKP
jgi:hypothetical protein